MGKLTPSPPRKKSRDGSSELPHQVGSTPNNRRAPDESCFSVGFDFASSSLGAIDGTSLCAPVINKEDNPSVEETNVVTVRRHHVEMTLFGAVCFHPDCMTRLGSMHGVSKHSLRRHFDDNQCYSGHRPDCDHLCRNLKMDLANLQEIVQKGDARADSLVDRVLPGNSVLRSKGSYCIKCGLVGIPSKLKKQHYGGKNATCNLEHLRIDGTIVKSNVISKVTVPEEVVTLIRQGKFLRGKWNDPRPERIAPQPTTCMDLPHKASDMKDVSTTIARALMQGHLTFACLLAKLL